MSHSCVRMFAIFFFISEAVLFVGGFILNQPFSGHLGVLVLLGLPMAAVMVLVIRAIYLVPLRTLIAQLPSISRGFQPESAGLMRPDEIGDLVRSISDISQEFRNTIDAAHRGREEARAVLSSMNEAVLVIGRDDRLIHMSAVVPKILDLRVGLTTGRSYWEVIRHDEINSLIKAAMAKGKAMNRELVIHNPGESFFQVEIAPVYGPQGEMSSLVVVMHDISALKKFDRMRSEFVANVSHELKTPLTSIRGYAETLRSGALEDREQAKRFIDIIDTQARRLEKLVSDVLSLARIEVHEHRSRSMELLAEDVGMVINEVMALQMDNVKGRRQSVEVLCAEGLKKASIDRSELEQVLLNLVDNAIKFTPEGGKITIRVEEENDFIRIDVEDNGIGIEQSHLDRLFERFYRVDTSRSRELGGTGLGLAIVKHIVLSYGGKVSVKSRPGQGSTFSVLLPSV